MCGDIPKGHYAKDVVCSLQQLQTYVRVTLPHDFEHVVEIRLREAFVTGAVTPQVWRVKVDTNMPEDEVNNAVGQGFMLGINNGTCTHLIYTNPRVVSKQQRVKMNDMTVSIAGVGTTNLLFTPVFTQAYFIFTFVMKDSRYEPKQSLLDDFNTPLNARGPFATRAPFQLPNETLGRLMTNN